MIGTVEKALAEIGQGKSYPVYLLHGDEFLAKDGAKAITGALVPREQQSLNVETVPEELELSSLPMRLNTLPLFGGRKIVVVHDSKAFVSKQTHGSLVKRSFEAWQTGEADRALRLWLQIVASLGEGPGFLDRAARGDVSASEWERLLSTEPDPEKERWLRDMAARAVAEGAPIPEAVAAGLARLYEEVIDRGIPPHASLILTAEVVDERRALYKKISALGFVIDCGVRSRKSWETQMRPQAARAKIRDMVQAAGKMMDEEAVASIIGQTGASMRILVSELEKILLYVGTRPAITGADVLEVLSHSREANIFELTNGVSQRDAGKALAAFRSLAAQREPVLRILNTLASEIRNLLLARSALERRLGDEYDPRFSFEMFRSRIWPLLSREAPEDDGSAIKLLEMNPFRVFHLLQGASRFSLQGLVQGLEAIHETDLLLKTSGQPEDLVLEQLLIRLCGSV